MLLEDDEEWKAPPVRAPAPLSASVPRPAAARLALSGLRSKSVVVSQWTSLLDLVGARLRDEAISAARVDGSMSAPARDAAILAFQSDPSLHVLLVSLNAGGTGITLTAAANVFVLDPSFNPAAMDQAIDRVHRLGQVAAVDAFLLVTKDSVEEKVMQLQERKRALAAGAFGAVRTRDDIRRARLDDLILLMGD